MKKKLNLKFAGLFIASVVSLSFFNNANSFLVKNVFAFENLQGQTTDYIKLKFDEDKGYSYEEINKRVFNYIWTLYTSSEEYKSKSFKNIEDVGKKVKDLIKNALFSIAIEYGGNTKLYKDQAYKAALYLLKNGLKMRKGYYDSGYFGNQFPNYLKNRGFEDNQIEYAIKKIIELDVDSYIDLIYNDIVEFAKKNELFSKPKSEFSLKIFLEMNYILRYYKDEKAYVSFKEEFIEKFIERLKGDKSINWGEIAYKHAIEYCITPSRILKGDFKIKTDLTKELQKMGFKDGYIKKAFELLKKNSEDIIKKLKNEKNLSDEEKEKVEKIFRKIIFS